MFSLISATLYLLLASQMPPAIPTNLSVTEANDIIQQSENLTILDVRTEKEFLSSRIEGATLIDFRSASFKTELAKLDRSQPYLIHCRSGRRSTSALETLKELGFEEVYHLDGGLIAWEEKGLPTVSGAVDAQ